MEFSWRVGAAPLVVITGHVRRGAVSFSAAFPAKNGVSHHEVAAGTEVVVVCHPESGTCREPPLLYHLHAHREKVVTSFWSQRAQTFEAQ